VLFFLIFFFVVGISKIRLQVTACLAEDYGVSVLCYFSAVFAFLFGCLGSCFVFFFVCVGGVFIDDIIVRAMLLDLVARDV